MKSNNNSRTKNSFLNLISGFGGQGVNILFNFVTRTVFIYVMGKEYLGINGLFANILSMLALTELGFGQAIGYRLYKSLAESNAKEVRVLMKFYKHAYRVVSLVIAILGLALIPLLPLLIKDYDKLAGLGINAVLVFCMYVLQSVSSYLFFAYRTVVIDTDQKGYILNAVQIAATFVTNIAQIAVLLLTGSFILYTAVLTAVPIMQNIFNGVLIKRMYPEFFEKEKDSLPRSEVITLFKDTGAAFVYRINNVVLQSTDNIVLSAFIGLSTVGMYSNYLMLYNASRVFLEKFFQACRASMGNIFAVDSMEKRYLMFRVMNFMTAVLYGTVCVGIVLLANEFIDVWIGEDYLLKEPFSLLIGIELLFSGLKYNLGQIRNISGVFRQLWYVPVLGCLINLIVSVSLVQYIGIYGVVIGTIVSDLLSNFMLQPAALYKHTFSGCRHVSDYYKRNLLYMLILTGVGAADYFLCSRFFTGMGILSVIIHGFICAVSVPAVFFMIFCKSAECRYLTDKGKAALRTAASSPAGDGSERS